MTNFIEISSLEKKFNLNNQEIQVLDGINLSIPKGVIFGIIGSSGAGKSTLVRCINRLEEPDSGKIFFDGKDICSVNNKELKKFRQKIGMIFQNFNLFESMTVYKNIEIALTYSKISNEEKKKRILELIKIVGLKNHISSYPSQLSGGQKQRVGIARAMANFPEVLLCDEATSALDPKTTIQILDLLREINHKFNTTLIIISHEISVIKYICDEIGIIERGKIVEAGSTMDVLSKPKSETGKMFIDVEKKLETKWIEKSGINDI